MGKGRFSLWTQLTWLSAVIRRGLDAGGESIMARGLHARAKAAIHSSFCLFGKRKGVCGLSLGKQSRDSVEKDRLLGWVSLSSRATCLCVCQGTKGTLVQAMTGSWPSPPPIASPPPCTLCTATAKWLRTALRHTHMTDQCM